MKNNIFDLKNRYKKGLLSKPEYIRQMHKFHSLLIEYSTYIKNTDITQIQIVENAVYMTTKKGIKFLVDVYDKRTIPLEILNFDNFESECLDMMQQILEKNDVVFDVGANIGWYTINLVKSTKELKIFAFEPIPKNYSYLKKNLELNNIKNVRTYKTGFFDKKTTLIFYSPKEYPGNTSLKNLSGRKNVEKIKCPVETIDNFVKREKIKIDLIKCDVEGAELFVIRGGLDTISASQPIIFLEMLRKWSKAFGYHPNEIISILSETGYGCYVIKKNKLDRFQKMDDNTKQTNFFFLHLQKHKSIIKRLSEK